MRWLIAREGETCASHLPLPFTLPHLSPVIVPEVCLVSMALNNCMFISVTILRLPFSTEDIKCGLCSMGFFLCDFFFFFTLSSLFVCTTKQGRIQLSQQKSQVPSFPSLSVFRKVIFVAWIQRGLSLKFSLLSCTVRLESVPFHLLLCVFWSTKHGSRSSSYILVFYLQ